MIGFIFFSFKQWKDNNRYKSCIKVLKWTSRVFVHRDLSYNSFPVLPTKGLKTLQTLKIRDNRELKEIHAADLPSIRLVEAHYPYHCCEFRKEKKEKKQALPQGNWDKTHDSWTWDEVVYLRNSYGEENRTESTVDDISGLGSGEVDPVLFRY